MTQRSIVIQLKTDSDMSSHPLGTLDELGKRHQIEKWLDEALRNSKQGFCDGGQIGAGTMEIFCEGITDLETGLKVVKQTLIDWELLYFSKIAWLDRSGKKWTVVYPEGSTISFFPE